MLYYYGMNIAWAAPITNINQVAERGISIGNLVIGLAISIAVVWIIISVVRYLIAGADSTQRKEGGLRILFGVVGLFVIFSIWGLVYILTSSFQTQNTKPDIDRLNLLGTQNNNTSNNNVYSAPNNSSSNNSGTRFDPYGQEYNPTSDTQLDYDANPRGQEP